jgi:hypothetical protein
MRTAVVLCDYRRLSPLNETVPVSHQVLVQHPRLKNRNGRRNGLKFTSGVSSECSPLLLCCKLLQSHGHISVCGSHFVCNACSL